MCGGVSVFGELRWEQFGFSHLGDQHSAEGQPGKSGSFESEILSADRCDRLLYGLVLSLKQWNSEYEWIWYTDDIHAYDDSMFIFCQKLSFYKVYLRVAGIRVVLTDRIVPMGSQRATRCSLSKLFRSADQLVLNQLLPAMMCIYIMLATD